MSETTSSEKDKTKKNIPINKYSIFELKSGIDQQITSYLESLEFKENHKLNTFKILVGLIVVSCTATAYFYPKPFPLNYNVILYSIIIYCISSALYWYLEKRIIKNTFYVGNNSSYCDKARKGKHHQIKEIQINSEVKDRTVIYDIWFVFQVHENNQTFTSEKYTIDCTKVYDERGYAVKEEIIKYFNDILKNALTKVA